MNTSETIGLIIALVISAIVWFPMIKVTLGNVWKYANDKPFTHKLYFLGIDEDDNDLGQLIFKTTILFAATVAVSFIIVGLASKMGMSVLFIPLGISLVVSVCYAPRMLRFLIRSRNAINKIGKAAHKHDSDGIVEDVNPGNQDY